MACPAEQTPLTYSVALIDSGRRDMLSLTRMDETALAGKMAETALKQKAGADMGRPRVSREKRETVGTITVENPRMVCRNVNVYYGDKQAIRTCRSRSAATKCWP